MTEDKRGAKAVNLELTVSSIIFILMLTSISALAAYGIRHMISAIVISDELRFTIETDPFLSVLGFVALFFSGIFFVFMVLLSTWHFSKRIARLIAGRFASKLSIADK